MTTIRHYTDDFKRDAIQYVESHPEMTMEQAAQYLGMPKETLYGWVKAYRRKQRGIDSTPASPMTEEEGTNDIYIGLTYLTKDNKNIIYDWRTPIASIFYDYESGDVEYEAPGGTYKGYLHNKRQFTIEDGKI